MANVLIRNVDEQTIVKLKNRAARNDRSLQAELQQVLERAATSDAVDGRAVAAKIRRKLGERKHSDSALLIAEDRRR